MDDVDFVKSDEFTALFNSDMSNYYVLMVRGAIANIGYSVDSVYSLKTVSGIHSLEKVSYDLRSNTDFDIALVEGIGTDYEFFSNILKNKCIPCYGRSNVSNVIRKEASLFQYKKVLLLVDLSAFGSELSECVQVIRDVGGELIMCDNYESFEYFLLKSEFIDDRGLQDFYNNSFLSYESDEILYEDRLARITQDKAYFYKNKSAGQKFFLCYYLNCCHNRNRLILCDKQTYLNKSKADLMFRGEFRWLSKYLK